MTYQKVETIDQALDVLNGTRERQAINVAIFEAIPNDGTRIAYADVIDYVHQMVDPIHNELENFTPSYTDHEPSGRRKTSAIRSALQWFETGATGDHSDGHHWITRDGKTAGFTSDGLKRADAYFNSDKYKPIREAVLFMDQVNRTEAPIVEEGSAILDDAMPIAACDMTPNKEDKVTTDQGNEDAWFMKMNAILDRLETALDQLEDRDKEIKAKIEAL